MNPMKPVLRLSILYMSLALASVSFAAPLDPARFAHSPKDSHPLEQNLSISVQLTDAANVSAVSIFYKSPDRSIYTQKTLQAGWQTSITSAELSPLGLGYYFEAVYKDGSAYRSRDYSTIILVMPPAIRELLYRDDASGQDVKIVQGELILKLDPGLAPDAIPTVVNNLVLRQNGKVLAIDNAARLVRMQVPSSVDLKPILGDLSTQSGVQYAHPHGLYELVLTPNDPKLGDQWGVIKMKLFEAWDVTTGDVSVIVAVIDTGRDPNHPDLVGRFLPGYDYYGNDPDPTDVGGHGTMVSGVIGATGNNATGVAGTNWRCKILPYRTGDNYLAGWAIVQSIRAAADAGARVINMSFGSNAGWQAEYDALKYAYNKGVVLVAAAGNSGASTPHYPAAYPEVIGVVATNSSDQKAVFSTYGDWVDVSAPGQDILTTVVGGGYRFVNGTSFASPYTAGVASLMLSVNPQMTNDQVRQILRQTAVDLGAPGFDATFGYGRIDAKAAVTAASFSSGDETAPIITHSPIQKTAPGVSVTLRATIVDSVSVHSATLLYRKQGAPAFSEVLMQYLGRGEFEGVIPKSSVEPPAVEYAIRARDPKGNTAQTPVYPVAMIDLTAPVVQHTKPDSTEAGLPMTVTATISDDVSVAEAAVFARWKGAVNYEYYRLRGSASGIYRAVLPETMVLPAAVQYYFTATDSAGNQPPSGNPGTSLSPHEVAVVRIDRDPPVITHTPLAHGQPSRMDVRVDARITDNSAVTAAAIYFRSRGQPGYDSVPMRPIGGDLYTGIIPAGSVVPSEIEYYLDARDAAGNAPPGGRTPGTAANPNVFIVAVDTIPPVIFHEALGDTPNQLIEGIPVKISAVVLDNRGVRGAHLHHKQTGASASIRREMTYTVSNRFEATLWDSDVRVPGLDYFLTAMDTDGNETTWGPVRVAVHRKIPVPTPKGDTWAYWIPGIAQVLMRDSSSGSFARLQVPPFDTANFAWSSDLTQLAMVGKIKDSWLVYVLSQKETFPTAYQVTSGDWTDLYPSWSADGKYLLFASNRDGDWDIFMKEWDSDGDGIPDKNGKLIKLSTDGDTAGLGSGEILGIARLTIPRSGAIVGKRVPIVGGAFAVVQADMLSQVPAESYRLEVGEGDTPVTYQVFHRVDRLSNILFDEELGVWDASTAAPGRHRICLVVKGNRRETRECATVWVPGLRITLGTDTTDLPIRTPSFQARGTVSYNFGPRGADLPVNIRIEETGESRTIRSDPFGNYATAFPTPARSGPYRLKATVTDTEGRFAETTLAIRVIPREIDLTLMVDPAETYPLMTFRAFGAAVYRDSVPVVNREVEFEIVQTFKRYYALTDTFGRFSVMFRAPPDPGAYTLFAKVSDGEIGAQTDTPFKVIPSPIELSERLSPPVTYVGAYVAVSGTAVYRMNNAPLIHAPVTLSPSWQPTSLVVPTDTAGRYIALIQAAPKPGTYPVQAQVTDSVSIAYNEKELLVLPLFGGIGGSPVKLEVTLRAIPDSQYRGRPVRLEGEVSYVYQKYRWPPDTATVVLSIDKLGLTWTETLSRDSGGYFKRLIRAPSIVDTHLVRAAATERFGLKADTSTLLRVLPLNLRLVTSISDTSLPARWPNGPIIGGTVRYIELDTPVENAQVTVQAQSGAGAWGGMTDVEGRFAIPSDFSRSSETEVYAIEVSDGVARASDTQVLRIDSDIIVPQLSLDTDVVPDAHTYSSWTGRPPHLILTANFRHPKGYPVYREGDVRLKVVVQGTNTAVWESTLHLKPIGPGSPIYTRDTYSVQIPTFPETYVVHYLIEDRFGTGFDTIPFKVYMPPCTGVPPAPGTDLELILDLDTHSVYPGQSVEAFGGLQYKNGTPYPSDRPVQLDNVGTRERWTANYLSSIRLYSKTIRAPQKPGQYEILSSIVESGMLYKDVEILTVLDTSPSSGVPIPFPPNPSPSPGPLPVVPDTKILVYAPGIISAEVGQPVEVEGHAVYTTGGPVVFGVCSLFELGSTQVMSRTPTTINGRFRFPPFPAPAQNTDYEIVVDDGTLQGRAVVRVVIKVVCRPPWQPPLPQPPLLPQPPAPQPPPPSIPPGSPLDPSRQKAYDELYPVQSPDGKYIAYSRRLTGSADPLNIFISRSDSYAMATQFTIENAGDQFPAWSPDGKRIAFGSKRSGNYDIWVKDVDGDGDGLPDAAGTSWKVTAWEGEDNKPTWSPDGRQLAFHSDRAGNYDLYVQNSDGSGAARRLTFNDAFDANPHWSSDGKYIVFHSNRMGRIVAGSAPSGGASIGLIMDESGSIGGTAFQKMVAALGRFLDNLPAGNPVSVTKFDHRVRYVQDFTEDKTQLKTVIGARIFNGMTAMYDGVMESMRRLSGRSGRRVAILLSDGWDNYSRSTPDQVIAYATSQNIQIFSIFVSSYGVSAPPALRRIAESTGGKMIEVDGFDGIEGGLQTVMTLFNRLLVNFNLWYMPAAGGEAKQLTDHIADDLYPAFSPDAKKIAFVSFRSGRGDIYVLRFNPDSPQPPPAPEPPPPPRSPGPQPPSPPPPGLLYPPIARCREDTNLTVPGVWVRFDGSASSDSDGTIDTYFWDFGDGRSGSGALDSHAYSVPGTYTIRLLVTDNDGLMDDDTCQLVIVPLPDTDPHRLLPTLSWNPSGMQDDDTSVVFQLRNMSNNPKDVARAVLVRPIVLSGEEYVDTVIFDTYDLGALAAVDTRPIRLTILTNGKWDSDDRKSRAVTVELRVVQELNWPQKNVGVSGRYRLVRQKSGGTAQEISGVSSGSADPVRWSLQTEITNVSGEDRLLNLEKVLPPGVRLAEARLPGGEAAVQENPSGPVIQLANVPLSAGETFLIQMIFESTEALPQSLLRRQILERLEIDAWETTECPGSPDSPRRRGIRGKIQNADSSTLVTLFDVTSARRQKISEVRATDSGDFDPPEIPAEIKTIVVRVDVPNAYPVFKRLEVSDGKIVHVLGTLIADTVDARRGHSRRIERPDQRQEIALGSAEDRARIEIPSNALDREFYVMVRDPKNLAEIETAASASGQRLLVAKEYVLLDAQTGEEIHSGFAKRIKVGLSIAGAKSGEVAKLAYFDPSTLRFEPAAAAVDPENHEIVADVEHFSVYVSLAAPTVAAAPSFSDFSQILVYPNPYEASFGTNKIVFENIPAGSTLTIYTVAGEKVIEIPNDGAGDINGSTRGSPASAHLGWDLTNRFGRGVASGMYLYLLKDSSGNTKRGRVGIVR